MLGEVNLKTLNLIFQRDLLSHIALLVTRLKMGSALVGQYFVYVYMTFQEVFRIFLSSASTRETILYNSKLAQRGCLKSVILRGIDRQFSLLYSILTIKKQNTSELSGSDSLGPIRSVVTWCITFCNNVYFHISTARKKGEKCPHCKVDLRSCKRYNTLNTYSVAQNCMSIYC